MPRITENNIAKEGPGDYIIYMVTEEMIKKIPKVELHDHLDGGLRPGTIIDLADEYGVELPSRNPDELASWFHRGSDRKNLALYLEGFQVTTAVMQTKEALERIAYEDYSRSGGGQQRLRGNPLCPHSSLR